MDEEGEQHKKLLISAAEGSGPVRVELPGPDPDSAGAIFVSQTLPSVDHQQGSDDFDLTSLDLPVPDVAGPPSKQLVRSQALLPQRFQPEPALLLPSGDALDVPWERVPGDRLLVPSSAASEARWRREWRLESYVTPGAVGLEFGAGVLSAAGWLTLLSLPDREQLILWLADLATRLELLGWSSPIERQLAQAMELPEEVQNRLLAEMGGRRPFLDPSCLTWVASELAVTLVSSGSDELVGGDVSSARVDDVRTSFLASTRAGWPKRKELLRSLWFLHEEFALGPQLGPDSSVRDLALASTAAQGAGVRLFGRLHDQLRRGLDTWLVDDQAPVACRSGLAPSWIRRVFKGRTGMPLEEWLAVWNLQVLLIEARVKGLEDPERLAARALDEHIGKESIDRFFAVIRGWMGMSPEDFGREILAELKRRRKKYEGVGSLAKTVLTTVWDYPLLQHSRMGFVPLGMRLAVRRAMNLPKFTAVGVSNVSYRDTSGALGYFYQQQVQDLVMELGSDIARSEHWVAGDKDLESVLGNSSHPDAAVAHRWDYLFVEVYSSALSPNVAAGRVESVRSRVETYHSKGDQAEAACLRVDAVARQMRGTRRVESVSMLLVTDETFPYNPAVGREMLDQRPDRNPRFVCNIDEFEMLVELGLKGWSVPSLVQGWQQSPVDESLGGYLERHTDRFTPIRRARAARSSRALAEALGFDTETAA